MWKRSVLVVANVTATSDELLLELRERAKAQPTSFMLVIPATQFGGGHATARAQLDDAVAGMAAVGLEVQGTVGHPDPIVAVSEAWDPKLYDEIVVSTLPIRLSKWLHAGLPERIERITGAPVVHIVSKPPPPAVETVPAPPHEDRGLVMGPLSVLTWGAHKQES
jgi:GABA permease